MMEVWRRAVISHPSTIVPTYGAGRILTALFVRQDYPCGMLRATVFRQDLQDLLDSYSFHHFPDESDENTICLRQS